MSSAGEKTLLSIGLKRIGANLISIDDILAWLIRILVSSAFIGSWNLEDAKSKENGSITFFLIVRGCTRKNTIN
jgi:hypothetical protein